MNTVTLFTVKNDPEVYFVTIETETTIGCKLLNKLEENCLADFTFNKDQVCVSLEVDLEKVTELFNVAASLSLLSSEEVKFDNFITKNVAFRFNGYAVFTKDDIVIVESEKNGLKIPFVRNDIHTLRSLLFYILE